MRTVDRKYASKAFAIFRTGLNGAQVAGAARGGLLVAAAGPGWVLVIDAATFLVAAGLRVLMRVEGTVRRRTGPAAELGEGWTEFAGRRWLRSAVGQFAVLGAVAADRHLGGAAAWGRTGLRRRGHGARRARHGPAAAAAPPVSAVSALFLLALPLMALAAHAPLVVVSAAALLGGVGVEVFGVNWMTTLQQEIPHEKFSRVAAYEAVGSFGLTPVGAAPAGPAADRFGVGPALWLASGAILAATVFVLSVPDVRRITRTAGADGES
ncbi:MAG: hypothetical protein QOI78_8699 [Actinomycetota bacterium]|nr:hypothetical protein [Actinomycetota bacterium]